MFGHKMLRTNQISVCKCHVVTLGYDGECSFGGYFQFPPSSSFKVKVQCFLFSNHMSIELPFYAIYFLLYNWILMQLFVVKNKTKQTLKKLISHQDFKRLSHALWPKNSSNTHPTSMMQTFWEEKADTQTLSHFVWL